MIPIATRGADDGRVDVAESAGQVTVACDLSSFADSSFALTGEVTDTGGGSAAVSVTESGANTYSSEAALVGLTVG